MAQNQQQQQPSLSASSSSQQPSLAATPNTASDAIERTDNDGSVEAFEVPVPDSTVQSLSCGSDGAASEVAQEGIGTALSSAVDGKSGEEAESEDM